ncbi:hypothetical protein ACFLQ6_09790 [Thermoproteota archaeon]
MAEGTNWEYHSEEGGEANTDLYGHRIWSIFERGQGEIIEFSPSTIIIKEQMNYLHSEKSSDEDDHQNEFSGTYLYLIDRESLIIKEARFYTENGTGLDIDPNPEGKPALQIISTEVEEGSSILYYTPRWHEKHSFTVSYGKLDLLGEKIPVITLRYSGTTDKDWVLGVNGTGNYVYHFEKSTGLLISYSFDGKIESEKGVSQFNANWKMDSISSIPKKETTTTSLTETPTSSPTQEVTQTTGIDIKAIGLIAIIIIVIAVTVFFITKRKKN